MKMDKQAKFILAIGLQLTIIFAIIFFKLLILSSGTIVFLKIRPIDPRDILRGDYVTFQYDISEISYSRLEGGEVKKGDTVYVVLAEGYKGYWVVKRVQKAKPSGQDEVFLRGKVDRVHFGPQKKPYNSTFHVIYGIEDYYIPEGAGRNVDFWSKNIVAQVLVDKNGRAVLKQIYINGKKWP